MILLFVRLVRAIQAKDWPTTFAVLAEILTKLAGGISAAEQAELGTAETHLINAAAARGIKVP